MRPSTTIHVPRGLPLGLACAAVLLAAASATTAQTRLVSRAAPPLASYGTGGAPSRLGAGFYSLFGSGAPTWTQASADGHYVVFESAAPNLTGSSALDTNNAPDVFIWDTLLQDARLISVAGNTGRSGDGPSYQPSISADGRYVAFVSTASNLVPGVAPVAGDPQVYLYDRLGTPKLRLVSHKAGAPLTRSNGFSSGRSLISADGQYVAFLSRATDLVAGGSDGNAGDDLYLWERASGTVTLVSHAAGAANDAANARSLTAALSADGRFVAYESLATNLVAGQVGGGLTSVFLFDRLSGANALVSHKFGFAATAAADESGAPSISADGAFVTFSSGAWDLLPGAVPTEFRYDVFLYERASGNNLLVSGSAATPGSVANADSFGSAISADGTVVAFSSLATDLVAGQVDGAATSDVFVYQRATGARALASHLPGASASSASGVDSAAARPALSADGRYVLYASASTALSAASDANGAADLFLFDGATGQNQLVSGVAGGAAATGDRGAGAAALSADGAVVAYESWATDLSPGLADVNGGSDVFVREPGGLVAASRQGQPSKSAGGDSGAAHPGTVSANGRYAVFVSDAPNLIGSQYDANDGNDVFLADLHTGEVILVSHRAGALSTTGDRPSHSPVISADGACVAFVSQARDLVSDQSGPGEDGSALFLWERGSEEARLVSHSAASATVAAGGELVGWPVLSGDGRYVGYASSGSDLVPGQVDANAATDVFRFDRLAGAGTNTLVSHVAGASATTGNAPSAAPSLSADGRYLAFESGATNLVAGQLDVNGALRDVFLHDSLTGASTLVSHAVGAPASTANGASYGPVLSADGARLAFQSDSGNLLAGLVDANGPDPDVYLLERQSGGLTLVSHAAGAPATTALSGSRQPALSADGLWLAFVSDAGNLVPGQSGEGDDAAFLHQASTGTNRLVSRSAASPTEALDGSGGAPAISADGRFVAFSSYRPNLVPGQVEGNGPFGYDVFLFDRDSGIARLLSALPGAPLDTGDADAGLPVLSAGGTTILFQGPVGDLVPDDFNARDDLFAVFNDSAPPSNPSSLQSLSHVVGGWRPDEFIEMQWSGAAAASGVAGYSVEFDTSASTTPDTSVDVPQAEDPHHVTSAPQLDGAQHYFHLRTCNQAGVCSAAVHAGPYGIDTLAPTPVAGLLSTSHSVGVPSADATIDVTWSPSSDATSGMDGYQVRFDGLSGSPCTFVKTVEEGVTSYTSPAQPDGYRWAHVCALDNAGNWTAVATAGPYRIATEADLDVVQTATPEPLSALGTLTYTLVVSNHGGLDASGVTLTDTLPSGVHFVSSAPAAPVCSHSAGVVTCALGGLVPQASSSVTLTVAADPGFTGLLDNHVLVAATEPDGHPANNSSSRLTRVVLQKGDLDNDAHSEILFRNDASGRYVAWLMNGTTRLTGRFISPDPASGDWLLSAVDDFDGDQRNDLVFWNQASGAVEFWLMNGTERQGAAVPLGGALPLPIEWVPQASADFDHDGHPDLLFRNGTTQHLVIWTLNGTSRIGAIVPDPDHAVDLNWRLVAALDLNDDANVDLLWYNTSSGKVVEWLMNAQVQRTLGRFTVPPSAGNANWRVEAGGDFGGNASPLQVWSDLVWRNATSGKLVVWQLDDQGQRLQGTFTTPDAPASPLSWSVAGPR